jgi:hypothetical protein
MESPRTEKASRWIPAFIVTTVPAISARRLASVITSTKNTNLSKSTGTAITVQKDLKLVAAGTSTRIRISVNCGDFYPLEFTAKFNSED